MGILANCTNQQYYKSMAYDTHMVAGMQKNLNELHARLTIFPIFVR
jgi:hypothetical protein